MGLFDNTVMLGWFTLLLLAGVLVAITLTTICLLKMRKLKKEYQLLMELVGKGENFNDIFNHCVNQIENVSRETQRQKNRIENIEKNMERCVQKVGVIRYKAHQNSGSDLFFAIALLDFEDNGVVLNGIYSRDNTTTTYAKPIEHGKSKYVLVKEEEEAIEEAKHNGYKCFIDLSQKR